MSIERVEKIAKSIGGLVDYKYVKIVIGRNDPKILIDIPITINTKHIYGYLSPIYTLMNPALAKKIKGTIVLRIYFKDELVEPLLHENDFDYRFKTLFFDESVGYVVSKDLALEKTPIIQWSKSENLIVPYMGLRSENIVFELNFNLIVSLLNEIKVLNLSIDDFSKEYLETLRTLKNYSDLSLVNIRRLGIAVPKANVLEKVRKNETVLEIKNFLNETIDIVKAKNDGVVLSFLKGVVWRNIGEYLLAIAFSR